MNICSTHVAIITHTYIFIKCNFYCIGSFVGFFIPPFHTKLSNGSCSIRYIVNDGRWISIAVFVPLFLIMDGVFYVDGARKRFFVRTNDF